MKKYKHYSYKDIKDYLDENLEKFISKMCKKISRKFNKFYGNEVDVTQHIKNFIDEKLSMYDEDDHNIQEIKASEINSGDMMVCASVCRNIDVKIDMNELTKAEWIDINKEVPEQRGFYMVLTDDHLIRGFAYFGKKYDEDTENSFEVWWATSGPSDGSEPQVKYWLKDHHWGLVYDFKKKAGELK